MEYDLHRCLLPSLVALLAVGLAVRPAPAAPGPGPAVSVVVRSNDIATEQMDGAVAAPLAEALAAVAQVDRIESESTDGACVTVISFAGGANPDVAFRRVRDVLAATQRKLPVGIDPPQVSAGDTRTLPRFWVAVRSDTLDRVAVTEIARSMVAPFLKRVHGVG